MAYRELLVKFHIEDVVNIVGDDGELYAHVVVRTEDGTRLKSALQAAAVIFDTDTDNLTNLDGKYKNSKGNLKHSYLGREGFERRRAARVDLRGATPAVAGRGK